MMLLFSSCGIALGQCSEDLALRFVRHRSTSKQLPGPPPTNDLKGPINAKDAVLVASWWMLREVELAAARIEQVTFLDDGTPCGMATLDLPVSKADIQALGKLRTHVCICPTPLCPVFALRRLVVSAKSNIGDDDVLVNVSAPPVPDFFGDQIAKKDMAAAFVAVAISSGMSRDVRITGLLASPVRS